MKPPKHPPDILILDKAHECGVIFNALYDSTFTEQSPGIVPPYFQDRFEQQALDLSGRQVSDYPTPWRVQPEFHIWERDRTFVLAAANHLLEERCLVWLIPNFCSGRRGAAKKMVRELGKLSLPSDQQSDTEAVTLRTSASASPQAA